MSNGNQGGGGGRRFEEAGRGQAGGGQGGYGGGGNRSQGGGGGYGGRPGGDFGRGGQAPGPAGGAPANPEWLEKVLITGEFLDRDLFSATAEAVALDVKSEAGGKNKPTQIRRFYDEFERLQALVGDDAERFRFNLPYIMKLRADVAYATARGNVSAKFAQMIDKLLTQVRSGDAAVLRNAKVFFEAYLCFAKLHDGK